ncbi:uncharacterized protein PG986_007224 [Apiospora aurea]|uniref:Uncharacterized protein n=1 Tax=Apiospora aurea TaxID=335848 RepID=A0ABR1QCR7_9PEZI
MDDDTDSGDTDDEYSSDDDFTMVSSDTESEYQNGTKNTDDADSTSDLEIIEDYFDRMLLSLHEPRHNYTGEEKDESQETSGDRPTCSQTQPPLSNSNEGMEVKAMNEPEDCQIAQEDMLVVCEDSIALRNGDIASQQVDEEYDHDDNADSWSMTSACLSDSWALEIEAAEEDRIAREQEDLAVPKTRANPYRTPGGSSPAASARPPRTQAGFHRLASERKAAHRAKITAEQERGKAGQARKDALARLEQEHGPSGLIGRMLWRLRGGGESENQKEGGRRARVRIRVPNEEGSNRSGWAEKSSWRNTALIRVSRQAGLQGQWANLETYLGPKLMLMLLTAVTRRLRTT